MRLTWPQETFKTDGNPSLTAAGLAQCGYERFGTDWPSDAPERLDAATATAPASSTTARRSIRTTSD